MKAPNDKNKEKIFQPGLLLWLFTGFFVPLFIVLGCWQFSRAIEKDQWYKEAQITHQITEKQEWSEFPMYTKLLYNGESNSKKVFLLDNKTYQGRFGYEVWCLYSTTQGNILLSLGWVEGSYDRATLPTLPKLDHLKNVEIQLRPEPKNPLFGVDANEQSKQNADLWVVQSFSDEWLSHLGIIRLLGYAQLLNSEQVGVGPNIWQPSVMTPLKHRSYGLQRFAMGLALIGMFIYAGLNRSASKPTVGEGIYES